MTKVKLAEQNSLYIKGEFENFKDQLQEWKEKAGGLVVTDESQTDLMKASKVARLALVKVRTSAKKKKDELKAEALAYNKAVQETYNFIESEIKGLEEHLKANECFVEIQEEKRLNAIAEPRAEAIRAEGLDRYLQPCSHLDDDVFEVLFQKAKAQRDNDKELVEISKVAKERGIKAQDLKEHDLEELFARIKGGYEANPKKRKGIITLLNKIIAWIK